MSVSVTTDPALEPYKQVTAWQLTVDGRALPEVIGYPRYISNAYGNRPGGSISASCDPSVDTGVSPGKHKVGVRATIAGISTPLTAESDVDLSCATTTTTAATPATEESSGCSASGRSSTTALAAIAFATMLVARRRR